MGGMIPLSVLDLAPILEGGDASQSFRNSLDLAQNAERLGYLRYWLAEHHNMPGIASAATSVVIGHVAAGTSTIRVGSGGIMLPNHAPLAIAEQFGTLEALFPGRIDLGLGRAPGTDQLTAHALRRTLVGDVDRFPQDVVELMGYLAPAQPGQRLYAVPGVGAQVPIWILGSSTYGAQLAAMLGLPYGFASHFAPGEMRNAIAIYRQRFQPSAQLDKPYVMLGINVVAADTDAEAAYHFTSLQQGFLNRNRGVRTALLPPVDDIDARFAAAGLRPEMHLSQTTAVVGGPDTVRQGLEAFIAAHKPDELMVAAQIYDHAARVRSYEVLAGVRDTSS